MLFITSVSAAGSIVGKVSRMSARVSEIQSPSRTRKLTVFGGAGPRSSTATTSPMAECNRSPSYSPAWNGPPPLTLRYQPNTVALLMMPFSASDRPTSSLVEPFGMENATGSPGDPGSICPLTQMPKPAAVTRRTTTISRAIAFQPKRRPGGGSGGVGSVAGSMSATRWADGANVTGAATTADEAASSAEEVTADAALSVAASVGTFGASTGSGSSGTVGITHRSRSRRSGSRARPAAAPTPRPCRPPCGDHAPSRRPPGAGDGP